MAIRNGELQLIPTAKIVTAADQDDTFSLWRRTAAGLRESMAGWSTPVAVWEPVEGSASSSVAFTAQIAGDAVVVTMLASVKAGLDGRGFWKVTAEDPDGFIRKFGEGPIEIR